MKKFIVKCFHELIRRTSAHAYIAKLQLEDHLKKMNDQCINKGTLYPEDARIDNFQDNRDQIVIGANSHIRGSLLLFRFGGRIEIGENVFLGQGSRIWSGESVKIGNNVLISHYVNIVDANSHEIDHKIRAERSKELFTKGHWETKGQVLTSPIIIEDDVWISFNVSILKGVTIGRGSIIGAGAVVTKSVPAFSFVKGPAAVATPLAVSFSDHQKTC